MDYVSKAFEHLGIGWPLTFGLAIYGLFEFADRQLSDQGRLAVQKWLTRHIFLDLPDSRRVLLTVFDAIYTHNLLSWRGFLQSAAISLFITLLMMFHFLRMTFYAMLCEECGVGTQFSLLIIGNVFADYVGLNLLRRLLASSLPAAVVALIAMVACPTIILSVYTVMDVARFSIETSSFAPRYFAEGFADWLRVLPAIFKLSSVKTIMWGALVAYCWIPLLGITWVLIRLLDNLAKVSFRTAQFVRDGGKRPLRVVGIVSGFLVFTISSTIVLATTWL